LIKTEFTNRFSIVGEIQSLNINVEAAGIIHDLQGSVVGRNLAIDEHIERGHALLPIQKQAYRPLLLVILVRPLQFRRVCGLPGQHRARRVFLDKRINQLFRVIALPDVFALESRYEQLVLIDFFEDGRNLHG